MPPTKEKAHPTPKNTRGKRKKPDNLDTPARNSKASKVNSGKESKKAKEDSVSVKWNENNDELTWALIYAIESNPEIKQGLFPPPGGHVSTSKGGGKSKVDHQWAICEILFSDNPVYSSAFAAAAAGTAKDRLQWLNKVKNRISTIVEKTKEGIERLGSTGEGLREEALRDGSKLQSLHDEIKKDTPWFREVQDLIAYRPNLIPTGIGNSQSTIDTSILAKASATQDALGDGDPATWSDSHPDQEFDYDRDEDDDEEDSGNANSNHVTDVDAPERAAEGSTPSPAKHTIKEEKGIAVKKERATKKAKAGTSAPAAQLKKTRVTADFTAMAQAEEETAKSALDMARLKAEHEIVKMKTSSEVRGKELDLEALKVQLKLEKLKHKNQVRLGRATTPFNVLQAAGPNQHFGVGGPFIVDPPHPNFHMHHGLVGTHHPFNTHHPLTTPAPFSNMQMLDSMSTSTSGELVGQINMVSNGDGGNQNADEGAEGSSTVKDM
ncbi:hypothetical protein BOTBODRAFT_172568 [Botryobasidium botryosum FD-172 SS1]|uniref:No apical meristem-associated C-terminal domain-containing protein n=1 Tax=Botryobasidium botryosum (strain FD-172 SS1) TaxID=930990 RepID=A0A067MN42_BOTB1|nr:hypothetical protein BOTBODRAFT_172568 [Botryobasidium botryosum FD-172 SS1]